MSNGGLISGSFSSDTTLSVPVAINKGGTGQTTAQAALDVLAAASGSLVQGDIFIVDSSGNVVRLARGSDDQTLLMNGSNPNWETVSAGGATVESVSAALSSSFSTSNTSLTDITGMSITKPNITDGKVMTSFQIVFYNDTTDYGKQLNMIDNTTVVCGGEVQQVTDGLQTPFSGSAVSSADGTTLKLQCSAPSGNTVTIRFEANVSLGILCCLGVG